MTIYFVRKPCFTLLELMVVLFIISFGVVLTGVKIKDIYHDQRFFSETEQVLSHLSMAQDLMLIMDTDVVVHFAQDRKSETMQMWLEIEKPIDESWARLVERKIPLNAIGSIQFDDKQQRQLTLNFSLGSMSQGELVLFEGDQSKSQKPKDFAIKLLGYPSPLGDKKGSSNEKTKSDVSELLYPAEVYEILYQDPNEKKNPKP